MPGILAPSCPGTGHHPSTIPEPSETDLHSISTKNRYHPDSDAKSRRVQEISEVRLPRPLRSIVTNTTELIERRNRLDKEVLREVEKKNLDIHDWPRRDKLLRNCEALRNEERYHLRNCTRGLTKLEALWQQKPSSKRYRNYSLVLELLSRFKSNLGPLLDEYTNRSFERDTDSDDTSPSDSASGSEWIDITESEDEETHDTTVAATSPSLPKQKSTNEPDSQSQNKSTIKDTNKEVPLSPQANLGKRKREKDTTESILSKKVRFTLDQGTDSQLSRQQKGNKNRNRGKKRRRKETQAPVQEVQTNNT
ncbi:hypothetical protein F4859DRAFT_302794 [Xylaria cf. heliscus]|nr:hypothetical protein F4859DRAFT_302794 [Xylaria cf. heliscus]